MLSNLLQMFDKFTSGVSPTLSLPVQTSHLPFEKHPKRQRLPSLQRKSRIRPAILSEWFGATIEQPAYLATQFCITCLVEAIPSSRVAVKSPTASGPYSVLFISGYQNMDIMKLWCCDTCHLCLEGKWKWEHFLPLLEFSPEVRSRSGGSSPHLSRHTTPTKTTTTTTTAPTPQPAPQPPQTQSQPPHQTCPDGWMPLPANHLSFLRLIVVGKNLDSDIYCWT